MRFGFVLHTWNSSAEKKQRRSFRSAGNRACQCIFGEKSRDGTSAGHSKGGLKTEPGAGPHPAARRFLILAIAFFTAVAALAFPFVLGIARILGVARADCLDLLGGLSGLRAVGDNQTIGRPARFARRCEKWAVRRRILRPYRRTKLLG